MSLLTDILSGPKDQISLQGSGRLADGRDAADLMQALAFGLNRHVSRYIEVTAGAALRPFFQIWLIGKQAPSLPTMRHETAIALTPPALPQETIDWLAHLGIMRLTVKGSFTSDRLRPMITALVSLTGTPVIPPFDMTWLDALFPQGRSGTIKLVPHETDCWQVIANATRQGEHAVLYICPLHEGIPLSDCLVESDTDRADIFCFWPPATFPCTEGGTLICH